MATQAQSLPAATDKQVARVQAKTANINRMGYYVDGWADLAENMGEKVEAVQDGVHQQLVDREMPDIKIHHVTANAGIFSSSSTRSYVTTTTFPGATTTVYVGKHGKDLYVSWRTFIKRIPNWRLLTAIALLALMMGISSGGCALLSGIQINRAANEFRGNVSRDPIGEFFGGYSGGQPETDYAPFYIIRPLQLMGLSFAALFVNTMGWFFAAIVLLAFLGWFLFQDPFYFLVVHPNWFDAEDITAMSLSVHKSLLKALDKAGIDTSKLRLKQEFKGGRKETI